MSINDDDNVDDKSLLQFLFRRGHIPAIVPLIRIVTMALYMSFCCIVFVLYFVFLLYCNHFAVGESLSIPGNKISH